MQGMVETRRVPTALAPLTQLAIGVASILHLNDPGWPRDDLTAYGPGSLINCPPGEEVNPHG